MTHDKFLPRDYVATTQLDRQTIGNWGWRLFLSQKSVGSSQQQLLADYRSQDIFAFRVDICVYFYL